MKPFLALMRREFLEHRGVFFYAPLVLLALFVAFTVLVLGAHNIDFAFRMAAGAPSKLYAIAYLGTAVLWWLYLGAMLFFYFADAFHADTRNNAMLFWKSMPVGDFTVLMSKAVAGVTLFPALLFAALLVSGVIVAVAALVLPHVVAGAPAGDIAMLVTQWAEASLIFGGYLVLALLWYAPFLAWVGALSSVVGRWSIPLALLLPVGASLFEGVFNVTRAPGGSYLMSYLRQRLDFNFGTDAVFETFLSPAPLDAGALLARLFAGLDWLQVGYGLLFAVVVIYLASRYRRRVIKG